jgi:hypothetical protein
LLVCLAGAGCNKRKACEHARDAAVGLVEANPFYLYDAPDDVKEEAKQLQSEDAQKVETHFVGVCLELEDQHMACIERVDEMAAATEKAWAARFSCHAAGETVFGDW